MSEARPIEDPVDARAFVFGGNARFTLVSKRTGQRYTFRMKKADSGEMYFASLLTGPDNTSDYQYLGFSRGFELMAGRKGNPNHPAYKALNWTLAHLGNKNMPGELEFWHEGRCCKCARVLTDPASIERGIGPECMKKG